ncbi:translational GTPase TypA [Anaerolineales bacterium HSG6]|nr:translational GTPase TypA [Anaerolineales bacterium HSG6]MDM8530326.1 translational GTPase TypA [Anaerolineales bacterium HSG25]
MKRTELRNIAIIAHVDHGKTTLVDGLLRQAKVFRDNQHIEERVMDSNDLERERGITILSKNTAITIYDSATEQDVKINVIDTPGHADFGGEVERVLNLVDGVLLLVDAAEGPMPQTRFVLKKALELGHRAIVVINKVDRRDADPGRVLNETFDLFIELGATDEQADFPVVYSVATGGKAGLTPDLTENLQPMFETILKEVPCPDVDVDAPLQMLVTTLDYDPYRGVTAIGRVFAGTITQGLAVARLTPSGDNLPEKVRYLYLHEGLQRVEVEKAAAGDVVAIAGLEAIAIGDTLCDKENPVALPAITVDEPTVSMSFGINTSPFSGREGKWATSRKLRDRLYEELKHNISLRVEDTDSADTFIVSGRGELHLAILIETMRREGYEFQVSRPEVIFKESPAGETLEPYEEVFIETSPDTVGAVVEMLGKRKGEMVTMENTSTGSTLLTYVVPTRGLLGFRYQFLTATRGMGIINSIFHNYGPLVGTISSRSKGSLVAWENGATNTFGLKNAEERGTLFLAPGIPVYQGMVVGEHQRPGDLDVNICKKKHLTNMRKSVRDIDVRLTSPREMSLDECIEYLVDDELLEVTPTNLRIRKRILDKNRRARAGKQTKVMMDK